MAKAVKTIGILTSGGDAPGMNAAIRSVVRVAISKGLKVKGIMRGYAGLLEEEIVDMDSTSVSDIINRGGTILYTARCKEFTTAEGQQKGAEICRKHGIDGMVVIGGDGSFRGAGKLSALGINTIGLPGTIDLDIACTDYTIGFDTAVNTAMEAIDKIRDTSTSHERCSIVEVMGRNAGYIAMWCGIANGAEDILLPERYDGDEQALINRIIENRKRGKKHNIIVNAEGIGHSSSMAKRIEAAKALRPEPRSWATCSGAAPPPVRTACTPPSWARGRRSFSARARATAWWHTSTVSSWITISRRPSTWSRTSRKSSTRLQSCWCVRSHRRQSNTIKSAAAGRGLLKHEGG